MDDISMPRAEFVARLRALGLRQNAFAALSGSAEITVYQWGKIAPVPAWAHALLCSWEALQAAHGDQWRDIMTERLGL